MKNEHKIILFTSIAHFFSHVYELTFPALAIPLMLSLNASLSEVLKLSFLMYLLLGLCALPWGMVADRYDIRHRIPDSLVTTCRMQKRIKNMNRIRERYRDV